MPNAGRKGTLLGAVVIRKNVGLGRFRRVSTRQKGHIKWPAAPARRPASIRIFGDTWGRAPWKTLAGSMSRGSAYETSGRIFP